VIDAILFWLGAALLFMGGLLDVIASIGMNRFKNFYIRLHAATIGSIGGAVYPLVGLSIMVLGLDVPSTFKYYITGSALVSALIIVLTSPAGSHILAKAAHKSREAIPQPAIVDRLKEDEEVSKE
jgi:multicomponent Na+:H+ antiporter subunit G